MSQQRILNYGDDFTYDKYKVAQGALNTPGVYSGYNITVVAPSIVGLSANGYLLQPDGILVTESTLVQLALATLPTVATVYTITCRHTDIEEFGGAPAIYAIEVGNYSVGSLSNGVVLGWINHPGGSVPLSLSFITQAVKNGGSVQINTDGSYSITESLYVDGELGIKTFISPSIPILSEDYALCVYDSGTTLYLVTKKGSNYYKVPFVAF